MNVRGANDEASARAPAVVKAARILSELAQHPDALSAAYLARRVEMAKGSVSDLCLALIEAGLLARAGDGRFLLGRHLVELARPVMGGSRLLEAFADACAAVPQANGETITMSIADSSDIVIVAVRRGSVLLPITPKIGLHLPIWTTAAGRALLSEASIEELRRILQIETATAAGVAGTIPAAEKLHADLQRESRLGVHIDKEQTAVGMVSVSAPLRLQAAAAPAAAIAISTRASLARGARRRALSSAVRDVVAECVRRSHVPDEAAGAADDFRR